MNLSHYELLTKVAYCEPDEIVSIFHDMDCSFSDAKGQNVLFPSIAKRKGLTDFFLDRGAKINQRNIDGNTPLHLAAANMDIDSTRILLERGADQFIQNKYGNQPLWTALMEAIKVVNIPIGYELLRLFTSHDADREHVNFAGISPRSFCDKNVKDEIIRKIIIE